MKHLSSNEFKILCKDAEILTEDNFGVKVMRLGNKTILKLFRIKRLISSARICPYSIRFANNAKILASLNIPAIKIIDKFKIPSIKRTAVLYEELDGLTLSEHLKKNSFTPETVKQLAVFLATLHNKGIYFRSIHFSNIFLLSGNELALIDITDVKKKNRGLGIYGRIRNFHHFLQYKDDKMMLKPWYKKFIKEYIEKSRLVQKKKNILKNRLVAVFNS